MIDMIKMIDRQTDSQVDAHRKAHGYIDTQIGENMRELDKYIRQMRQIGRWMDR